jgi:hypothetical protein
MIIDLLDLIRHPFFYLKTNLREWTLSTYSSKSILIWALPKENPSLQRQGGKRELEMMMT